MSNFYFNWWWPSIKGNGPEDLTSLIIVGIVASILIPRVRRWWKVRAEHLAARERELHAKIDHAIRQNAHLINHTKGVPNIAHDGVDLTADHEGNPLTQESK
jgi:type II secretory pathway pseudopilin PulG